MLKKISVTFAIATALLLLPSVLKAQDKNSSSTSSPYSRFGIGTLNGNSLGRSEAMGGIGIGTRYGFQINTGNPASYTAIDSMTLSLIHISEPTRRTPISYAVFCLKKKKNTL